MVQGGTEDGPDLRPLAARLAEALGRQALAHGVVMSAEQASAIANNLVYTVVEAGMGVDLGKGPSRGVVVLQTPSGPVGAFDTVTEAIEAAVCATEPCDICGWGNGEHRAWCPEVRPRPIGRCKGCGVPVYIEGGFCGVCGG
jgi:hypothetical protein